MSRKVYLVLVNQANKTAPEKGNNKFYNMTDNGDGTFSAEYGRVGSTQAVRTYPISQWDKKYNEKTRKGYTDVTELQAVGTTDVSVDHDDPLVAKLLDDLYKASHGRATKNYRLASFGSVTQAMLDKAQALIDTIATASATLDEIRRMFLELYVTIPRQMDNVEWYLPSAIEKVNKLVESEQETLESLRGQVVVAQTGDKVNLLDSMGISIKPVTCLEQELEKSNLRYRRGFEVRHERTAAAFKAYEAMTKKLLYHGSRKANWLSILQGGLQIRPAANGTNFGKGIYFADDYEKSKQYTDGYMGVYEVAIGTPHVAKHINHSLSLENIKGDSVLGSRGYYKEYVIFRPEQCRIRYFLDVR